MASHSPRNASLASRRAALAVTVAAAATLFGAAIGALPTAGAAWDIEQYDSCIEGWDALYLVGEIATVDYIRGTQQCCVDTGGSWQTGHCGAPPAIAAGTPAAPPSEAANPDVAAGPPPPSATKPPTTPGPTKAPKTTFTLAPIAPVG